MKTYMNETTMNLVNNAIADFNRRASKLDTIFCHQFDALKRILIRDTASIISDLSCAERVGCISHDEYVGIYGDIERMRNDAISAFKHAEFDRLGEREYTIRYTMYAFDYTREKAEQSYDEDWE